MVDFVHFNFLWASISLFTVLLCLMVQQIYGKHYTLAYKLQMWSSILLNSLVILAQNTIVKLLCLDCVSALSLSLLIDKQTIQKVKIYYVASSCLTKILLALHIRNQIPEMQYAIFICILLIKSSVFPFHNWLYTCVACPTFTSIILHTSTLVTTCIYLLKQYDSIPAIWIQIIRTLSFITVCITLYRNYKIQTHKQRLINSTQAHIACVIAMSSENISTSLITKMIAHGICKAGLFVLLDKTTSRQHCSWLLNIYLFLNIAPPVCLSQAMKPYTPLTTIMYLILQIINMDLYLKLKPEHIVSSSRQHKMLGYVSAITMAYPIYKSSIYSWLLWLCGILIAWLLDKIDLRTHIGILDKLCERFAYIHTINIIDAFSKLYVKHISYLQIYIKKYFVKQIDISPSNKEIDTYDSYIPMLSLISLWVMLLYNTQGSPEISVIHLLTDIPITILLYKQFNLLNMKIQHSILELWLSGVCAALLVWSMCFQNTGLETQYSLQTTITLARGLDTLIEMLILWFASKTYVLPKDSKVF